MRRRSPAGLHLLIVTSVVLSACGVGGTAAPSTTAPLPLKIDEKPPIDRRTPPVIDGLPLPAPTGTLPVPPNAWGGDARPVPMNNWWAPLATGRGASGIWPTPLTARVEPNGRTSVALPSRADRPDGTYMSNVNPTFFVEATRVPVVVGSGAIHATWRYDEGPSSVTMTMVQGSPFVEFEGTGTLRLTVPSFSGTVSKDALKKGSVVQTSTGPWVAASSGSTSVSASGDQVHVDFGASGRFVFGPLADGAGKPYVAVAVSTARHRLAGTRETLRVLDDGSAEQTLAQVRAGSPAVAWVVADHQLSTMKPNDPDLVGTIRSAQGQQSIVARKQLVIRYDAVPVLWSPVGLSATGSPESPASPTPEPPPIAGLSRGSYFGGKAVATMAVLGQLSSDPARSSAYWTLTKGLLGSLVDPVDPPNLAWESQWGRLVVEPAEFGSLDQFNDHQLQFGYWVLAASLLVEHDPSWDAQLRETIDAMIADYRSTWSPFDGHTWSSGITDFVDGNNMESSSESTAAWWAAARWFLVTGRPEQAARYLARLTIESRVDATQWLPERPMGTGQRPWTGVVWSGKADNNTWFDPAPEAALGIRLLPLGPQSFSRYPSASSVSAAQRRWDWCENFGNGCKFRWANLLDSDAVVAGRPAHTGPDPEPSTPDAMVSWWRSVWTRTSPEYRVSCTPGVVARLTSAGERVALVTNPTASPLPASCRDRSRVIWRQRVAPGTATVVKIS